MISVSDSDFTGMGAVRNHGRLVLNLLELMAIIPASLAIRVRRSIAINRAHKKAIRNLEAILVEGGYSGSSARKYSVCVARFLAEVGSSNLTELRDDDVVEFLFHLKEGELSNGYIRLHLCAIRAVFDRLLGLSITDGIAHVPRPAPRPPAPAAEIRQLRGACESSREHQAIDLLNGLKTRPSETVRLAFLKVEHPMAAPEQSKHDTCSDTGQGAMIPIVVSGGLDARDCDWLFPSRQSHLPITVRTLQRIVERVRARCGLQTTCTAIRLAERLPFRAVS